MLARGDDVRLGAGLVSGGRGGAAGDGRLQNTDLWNINTFIQTDDSADISLHVNKRIQIVPLVTEQQALVIVIVKVNAKLGAASWAGG